MKSPWMKAVCVAVLTIHCLPCASAAKPAKPARTSKAPENAGYVLLRVAKNTAFIGRQGRDFTIARVVSTGPVARSWTLNLLPGGDRTRTFGATLPEGNYRILSLAAPGIEGDSPVLLEVKPPEQFGTFQVRAQTLTWLDTVVYQPLGARAGTLVPVASGVNGRALLAQLAPDTATAMPKDSPDGWLRANTWSLQAIPVNLVGAGALLALVAVKHDEDYQSQPNGVVRGARSESELLALMKKSPGQINGGSILADGTAFYGSSFGQIWKRASGGMWSTLDTGCVCDILSVTAGPDALYAGTESGVLLRTTDGGTTFAEVARIADGHGIAGITSLGNGEWVISTQRIDSARKIQRRHFYLVGDLAQLATAPPSKSFEEEFRHTDTVSKLVPLSAGAVQGGFAILEAPNKLHRYDASAGSWTTSVLRAKRIERLSFTHSGSVLFSEDAGLKSIDGGMSWSKFDTRLLPAYLSVMYDASSGFQMIWYPASIRSANLYFTADGGSSWKMTGERDGLFCPAAGANEITHQVYCLGHDGVILATERGDKWTAEKIAP